MSPKKRLSVLLADDGSEHARSAVKLLLDLPLPPQSRITVLRVFNSGQIPLVDQYESLLDETKKWLVGKGYRVEADLQLGSASEKIVETAEANKVDLIVMGANGLRATAGILLGGVAQQVVEYARCAVLVVRAPIQSIRRVLVVTDGSSYSLNAVRYLSKFSLPAKADVHVMHVLPPAVQALMMEPHLGSWQTVYATFPSPEDLAMIHERQKKKGEALLARTANLLKRIGIESTPELVRGDAATEIIDYVNASQTDLIVAGSRGFSQIKGWWMGSVSRKLVHYSSCSVLIVKGLQKGARPWK